MSDTPGPSKRVRYDDPEFGETLLQRIGESDDEYGVLDRVYEQFCEVMKTRIQQIHMKKLSLEPNCKKLLKPTQAVLRLIQPVKITNRNITADNWFTSVELLNKLKENCLTYLGVIEKIKKTLLRSF
ncbi:hypothetical protein JTB14_033001 [Gonioctena quinquepunctata]|nr:hypothetical protein JTB14_033001 [Gonioctena quinquepunctata]